MVATIECCVRNADGVRELPKNIRIAPCLGHCDRCRQGPFLVLDGRVVSGPTHRSILDRVSVKGTHQASVEDPDRAPTGVPDR